MSVVSSIKRRTPRPHGLSHPHAHCARRGGRQTSRPDVGADDYVTKPFSPREVVARVRALLRRARIHDAVVTGGLELDECTRAARLDGAELTLSKLEFDLLLTLACHPGFVWSRERLLERVWGADFPGVERIVDVHMAGLRMKLGENLESPRFIETVRGVGYRFREDA